MIYPVPTSICFVLENVRKGTRSTHLASASCHLENSLTSAEPSLDERHQRLLLLLLPAAAAAAADEAALRLACSGCKKE